MNNELPQAWAVTKLGELFEFKYGKGLPQEKRNGAGSVPVYGSNGVVGSHNHAITRGTTIVVGRKGSVGEVHLSPQPCWPIDTTYFIDEFPEGWPPLYWKLFLESLRLGQQEKSSAIPGISRSDVYQLEVAIPPVAEQRRIVAKLEKLLDQVDSCQQRLSKIPGLLKQFRQSVLAAACSGRLTADWREVNGFSEEFEQTTINAIAEYVGGFAYKSPTFLESGKHQVIRIGNVRPLALKLSASPVFIPDEIAYDTEGFKLQTDDLVISMTGTKYKKDYGCAGIVQENDGSLYLNQRVARIRCRKSVLPKFLLFWLQTDLFRDFFFAGETGNVNQGNVGAGGIRNAPIELPPLREQQEIVRRVERMFALADRIESRFVEGQKRVDSITQAILAKAFRGELVPTEFELAKAEGRSFESAEELLQRIRQNGDPRKKLQKAPQTSRAKETLLKKNRHLQKSFRREL